MLRIVQLLDPLRKALENQNATDIDLRLKEDLERFIQYVSITVAIHTSYRPGAKETWRRFGTSYSYKWIEASPGEW